MPTLATIGPYRFYFYSNEGTEPPHVHVKRDRSDAKFWLDPITLETSRNFSSSELREITRLVNEHHLEWMEKWNDYFNRNQ